MNSSLAQSPPAKPEAPKFATVSRGFHPDQVNNFLHGVFGYISHLEQQLAHGAQDTLHFAESPKGERLMVDMMRIAVDEIDGERAQAARDIAQMIADAQAKASSITSQAQQEATALLSGARQQADTVLAGARADAKRMTDTAAAESAAVTEGAGRRMAALTEVHDETLRRLQQVHDVVGSTLAAEDERGSLEDEKNRALGATSAVAASAPAQLTAG